MGIVGIDFSVTGPALVKLHSEQWDTDMLTWVLGTTSKAKYLDSNFENLMCFQIPIDVCTQQRAETIAIELESHIEPGDKVFIEDYSYGSTGDAIHTLAESCGILKYILWKRGECEFTTIPVTAVKKFAFKGNAKKPEMYEALLREGVNLEKLTGWGITKTSPLYDLTDAYWVCKCGYSLTAGEK